MIRLLLIGPNGEQYHRHYYNWDDAVRQRSKLPGGWSICRE